MNAWTTDTRQGYRTKTIQIGNATVIVHRPVLEAAELERREKEARQTMEPALRSYIFRRGRGEAVGC